MNNEIYKAVFAERQREELQPFPAKLLNNMEVFEKDANLKKLIRDLMEKRERKILSMALVTSRGGVMIDTSNLTKDELRLFNEILVTLKRYSKYT